MAGINIFDIRGKVKKEVDFIPGAWVEFYDDMTVEAIIATKNIDVENPNSFEQGLLNFFNQIADWNFADRDGKVMEVTFENMKRLPMKIISWMGECQRDIVSAQKEKKSLLPEN